uniref:Uncharacterized protein n=1 Tax=Leersia perrieri TaxID=77586 RepID=A0A0D9XBY2_9ORYZ
MVTSPSVLSNPSGLVRIISEFRIIHWKPKDQIEKPDQPISYTTQWAITTLTHKMWAMSSPIAFFDEDGGQNQQQAY